MGRSVRLASGALVLAVGIISWTYEDSSSFARPIQSSIIGLTFCGFLVLVFGIATSISNGNNYALLLQDQLWSRGSPRGALCGTQPLTPREVNFLFQTTFGALSFRIALFQLAFKNRQCTISGAEGYVPLFLAIYDYWYNQRRRPAMEADSQSTWLTKMIRGPTRCILPTAILSGASIYTSAYTNALRSTYICPLSSFAPIIVPLFQILAALLDCYVLISIEKVTRRGSTEGPVTKDALHAWVGTIFVLSAIPLFMSGLFELVIQPKYWKRVLWIDRVYIKDLTRDTFLFAISTLCAVEIVGLPLSTVDRCAKESKHMNHGLLHLSLIVTFVCTYTAGFLYDLLNREDFVPLTQTSSFLSSVVLFLGAALYLYSGSLDAPSSFKPAQRLIHRIPSSPYTILILLLVGRALYQLPKHSSINVHPIKALMQDAAAQSQAWLTQASTSKTLPEAVETYRRRYHYHPPPGFDVWYKYAIEKSSLVIDDYDRIHEDLLPFWSLTPKSIRASTREIISDEWNEVAEVTIRSGKAEVGPNVIPTHRWMLDGVLATIEGFVQWLPDMDLAFNINDEPRIAIPWKTMQKLQELGKDPEKPAKRVLNTWSEDRSKSWRPLGDLETPKRPFEDHSFTNSFAEYGSTACPPSSMVHKSRPWDQRTLCASCAAPHSTGIFLSNWTLSASPCHQPDLTHLHGFYLSPAAFKPSHSLLPVFSQSKAHGYADILYPSAWNYIDKVKYSPSDTHPDPPFASKENTLFWRGATSEGLAKDATWKGMARQRLVHLVNNATCSVPILLPSTTQQPTSYTYSLLPPSSLGLNLDMGFVDSIARCWDSDCTNQASEFGLVGKTDFQDHWHYRFLFDLDGAGFSGRFLPFLQSRSLVFKTAIFREWWDGRVFPWRHFIPVDVRFHGLFGTYAYFAGTNRTGAADVEQNLEAGAEVAEAGREWVGKVLRKEDMEIYMFRLLLEWGRLTDDRRDELGYTGGAE